jgi:hypothetical protein
VTGAREILSYPGEAMNGLDRRWTRLTRRDMLHGSMYLVGGSLAAGCHGKSGANAGAVARTELDVPESSRAVQRAVAGVRKREGAGFEVRRPFPTQQLPLVDPFLLLDEFGPSDYGPREALGAPDHPHRGFETVSYVLEGDIHHRDSMGHDGAMGPGGVQWMTAGAGIVHSEMPSHELFERGGRVHGFQLWVNLPRDLKMMQPHYQELQPADVAVIETERADATGRIVAGEALGARGAIATTLPTSYQHWTLRPGAVVQLPIPNAQRVAAYVFRGTALVGADARPIEAGTLAILGEGEAIRLGAAADASADADVLLLAAAPLGEPVARRGPFVMNTDAEIQQAYADYQAGRVGRIPPAPTG